MEVDIRYSPQVETELTCGSAGRITSAVQNAISVTYARDSAGCIQSEIKAGKTAMYSRDSAVASRLVRP